METLQMTQLLHCHICDRKLKTHPLHDESVAKTCTRHGDFFLQRQNGQQPCVIFRPFDKTVPKSQKARPHVPSKVGKPGVMVRCDQTGDIFRTINEAAYRMGLDAGSISWYLAGRRESVGGYTFTKLIHDKNDNLVEVARVHRKKDMSKEPIPIICEQTGIIYRSIHHVADELGVSRGNIYTHLKDRERRAHVGGYTFRKAASQEIQGL